MKTKQLLISLLFISISFNLFTLMTSMAPIDDCPELRSYTNAVDINNTDAQSYIDAFQALYPNTPNDGGIIAGNAFETMFCAQGTNGIGYHFAIDPSGNIGKGGIFLVLLGADVVIEDGKITSSRKTGTKQFITNNWCPPNCVYIE